MDSLQEEKTVIKKLIALDDLNRVLDVGRLLFSVLSEEEIEELQRFLNDKSAELEIGNTGLT